MQEWNLYEMSSYKSCWSWLVSQFLTCKCLLRHGCQRNSFWKSQTDSQMYTFPDQMNWQIFPDINGFPIPLKTSCTGHSWRKAKDFFVFYSGNICLVLFQGCYFFVLRHLCPVHKINAPKPITTILATHLLREFIVNVKHRMDWSYRKPYMLVVLFLDTIFSCWWNMFNFGEYAEICHLPLTSLK